MFIFESSKDKELKRIIDSKLHEAISSEAKYEANKDLLASYCQNSDKKAIEKLVDTVKETIKDEDQSPKTKFYAIKLLHDTMKTQNKLLGNYVVKKILKRLAILAAFKKESKDESRGKSIFGKVRPDQENYAKKFHHQLLDSLREWGTSWPRGADGPHLAFKEKYEELVKQQVVFPQSKGTVNPQILKQKLNKDRVDLKGFNQPKKYISPERPQIKNQREFSSGNAGRAIDTGTIDKNKMLQINTFLINIDETFSLVEEMSHSPEPEVLMNIVEALHKELMKGDDHVSYLLSQNRREFEGVVSDITADFEFIEEVKADIRALKTPASKQKFVQKYKLRFQERRRRRQQNELQASILNLNLKPGDAKLDMSQRHSFTSRRSDQKPTSEHPSQEPTRQAGFGRRQHPIPVQDNSDRRSSSGHQRGDISEKSQEQQKRSSDQPTGRFTVIKREEVVESPHRDIFPIDTHFQKKQKKPPGNGNSDNKPSGISNTDLEKSSSSALGSATQKEKQPSNKKTSLPLEQSTQNIHSTSIMKKYESSNMINQSMSKQKNSNGDSFPNNHSDNPFSGSTSQPSKTNPFESFENIKRLQSSGFSTFGARKESKEQVETSSKQVVFEKIEENPHESQEDQSTFFPKRLTLDNPFEHSMVSEREKTNPFESEVVDPHIRTSTLSNPFSTKKSELEKTNPFQDGSLDDSKDITESQLNGQQRNTLFDFPILVPQLDKSIDNPFQKKKELDFNFNFNFADNSGLKETSRMKGQAGNNSGFGESAFIDFQKPSMKEDFFIGDVFRNNTDNNQVIEKQPQFDFPPAQKILTNVDTYFEGIKASSIFPPKEAGTKEMMVSNIKDFDWFQPGDKPNHHQDIPPDFEPMSPFIQNNTPLPEIQIPQHPIPSLPIPPPPSQPLDIKNKAEAAGNPDPESEDLSLSQFPIQNISETKKVVFLDPPGVLGQDLTNSGVSHVSTSRRKPKQSPFGVINPDYEEYSIDKLPVYQPPQQIDPQVPTRDQEPFSLQDSPVVPKQKGALWNPFEKKNKPKTTQQSPVLKSELIPLQHQLTQIKQFHSQEQSQNNVLKEQFLGERATYLQKLKRLEVIQSQKIEYENIIKKTTENISLKETQIAEESKRVNQLKALKDRRNECLRRLFEIRTERRSSQTLRLKASHSSRTNKFLAFNETAKNLHSLANSKAVAGESGKGNTYHSFHHTH